MKMSNIDNDDLKLVGFTTYTAGLLESTSSRRIQNFCDSVLLKYGITKSQWIVIGSVYECPEGVSITSLARELDTTLAYVTGTVNMLESKNIFKKITSPEDKRAKVVTIHHKFIKKIPIIEKDLRDKLKTVIYADISYHDFRTYLKVLSQLSQLKLDEPAR